jgi:hypothetical protein
MLFPLRRQARESRLTLALFLLLGAGLLAAALTDPAAGGGAGAATPFAGQILDQPPQTVGPGEVILVVDLKLPLGWQLTPDAPLAVKVAPRDQGVLTLKPEAAAACRQPRFPLRLPLAAKPGQTVLAVDVLLNFCREDGKGLCLIKEARLQTPVTVDPAASGRELHATYQLTPPVRPARPFP